MLNRVLRITIVVVFAVTGLILTEYLLPYISDYFDYKFYGNGFFGSTADFVFQLGQFHCGKAGGVQN